MPVPPRRPQGLRTLWSRLAPPPGRLLWLGVHLGLGLAWIGLLASRAEAGHGIAASGPQVFQMLLLAGWLSSMCCDWRAFQPFLAVASRCAA